MKLQVEKFQFSKVMPFIPCNTITSVLHGVPRSIVNCTLEALQDKSRFWDHTFSQAEFAKESIVHGWIGTYGRVLLKREGLM